MQYRSAEQSADLIFCKISGKEQVNVAESEDSGTTDFVRNDQKKGGILKKVILTLISIAVIVVGELIREDDDLKKW